MKLPIFLRIFLNGKLEGIKQFDVEQIVIGKNPDVQLQLVDDSISPLHAMIEERDNGYYLSDLGSQSGVLLNGENVLDASLESGNNIELGPYRLEFFIGLPKPGNLPDVETSQESAEVHVIGEDTGESRRGSDNFSSKGHSRQGELLSAEFEVDDGSEDLDTGQMDHEDTQTITTAASIEETMEVDPSLIEKSGFAPPSSINDLTDYLKPGKGAVVEVLVAWKERIIDVYHFSKAQTVTIGATEKADIKVPVFGNGKFAFPLAKIGPVTTVLITPDMKGELIQANNTSISFKNLFRQNRVTKAQQGYFVNVQQGEMIRIGFQNDLVSIYIRYIEKGPKPIAAPILDLTTSEMTGVVLAVLVSAIFGLYMMVYSPQKVDDESRLEEPLRKAVVIFKVPKPKVKKIVKLDKIPQKVKKVVNIMQQPAKKKNLVVNKKKSKSGKVGGLKKITKKPKPPKVKQVKTQTNRGGGTNARKASAAAKTKKIDVKSLGMLGALSSGGRSRSLKKSSSGSSKGLIGLANRATGTSGVKGKRSRKGLGSKLRKTTSGGLGRSTVGISDNVTEGMGIGKKGAVSGSIGSRGKANLVIADREAVFTGSIDKEAIRRVIREHRREIRSCYERQLTKQKDIYGKLVLEWDIEEQGRVTAARAAENRVSKAVANCIIRKLKTWRFPEPPPNQIGRVRYPFIFTTQN